MVVLLERLYRKTLIDAAFGGDDRDAEGAVLRRHDPAAASRATNARFSVAHKTGFVQETKVGCRAGPVRQGGYRDGDLHRQAPRSCRRAEQHRHFSWRACRARAIWNHFTGMTGYAPGRVNTAHVDWNMIPGGKWGIWRSPAAPFPHPERANGLTRIGRHALSVLSALRGQQRRGVCARKTAKPARRREPDRALPRPPERQHGCAGAIPDAAGAGCTSISMPSWCFPRVPTGRAIRSAGRWKIPADSNALVDDVLATMKKEKSSRNAEAWTSSCLVRPQRRVPSGGVLPGPRRAECAHHRPASSLTRSTANFDYYQSVARSGERDHRAAYTDHLAEEHTSFAAGA